MADIDITHPAITDLEKESFEDLCRYIKNDEVALVRVNYQGLPRVVIAVMSGDGEFVDVFPIAMILNDVMFHAITPLPGATVSRVMHDITS